MSTNLEEQQMMQSETWTGCAASKFHEKNKHTVQYYWLDRSAFPQKNYAKKSVTPSRRFSALNCPVFSSRILSVELTQRIFFCGLPFGAT